MRFIRVEILIYSMRMILLISNLKLIGHRYLDPIFVSICGLIQAFTVVFKSMRSKKNYFKLDIEDIKDQQIEKGDNSTTKKNQVLISDSQLYDMKGHQNDMIAYMKRIQVQKELDQFSLYSKMNKKKTTSNNDIESNTDEQQSAYSSPPSPLGTLPKGSKPGLDHLKVVDRKLSIIPENETENVEENIKTPKKKDKANMHEAKMNNSKNIFRGLEKQKQIDDVYDEKVFLEGHQLYTLRKGSVLNYMSLHEMSEFSIKPSVKEAKMRKMNIPDMD